MSMPNPFIPAGSLMAERQRRNRAQFKVGVYAVLAAHVMLLLGVLIQGCKSDDLASSAPGEASHGTTSALAPVQPPSANLPSSPASAATASLPSAPAIADIPPGPLAGVTEAIPAANAELFYTVKSGDTLIRIAKAHGTTVAAIQAANALNHDRITVGLKLKLPAGASVKVAATAGN
jgi:nucleoid-associated protein YgaU